MKSVTEDGLLQPVGYMNLCIDNVAQECLRVSDVGSKLRFLLVYMPFKQSWLGPSTDLDVLDAEGLQSGICST